MKVSTSNTVLSHLGGTDSHPLAVQWFRSRFNDCFEKAEWAKARCPENIPATAAFAERMLYDRAVELVSFMILTGLFIH